MFKIISTFISLSALLSNLAYAMSEDDQARAKGAFQQQPVKEEEEATEAEVTTHRFKMEYMGKQHPMTAYKFVDFRPKPQSAEGIRREKIRKHYIQLREMGGDAYSREIDRADSFSKEVRKEHLSTIKEIEKDYAARANFFVEELKKGTDIKTNNDPYFFKK